MVWTMTVFKTQILPTLKVYKQLYGDTRVPVDFRVPNVVKSAWTPEMWDLPLGRQVSELRSGRHIKVDEEDKRALEALGFSIENTNTKRWNSLVFPALMHYCQEYHGASKSQPLMFGQSNCMDSHWVRLCTAYQRKIKRPYEAWDTICN